MSIYYIVLWCVYYIVYIEDQCFVYKYYRSSVVGIYTRYMVCITNCTALAWPCRTITIITILRRSICVRQLLNVRRAPFEYRRQIMSRARFSKSLDRLKSRILSVTHCTSIIKQPTVQSRSSDSTTTILTYATYRYEKISVDEPTASTTTTAINSTAQHTKQHLCDRTQMMIMTKDKGCCVNKCARNREFS